MIPEEESVENSLLSQYAIQIEEKLDLEKIKEAQNFKGVDVKKMNRLVKQADIEESIDELLEMLDELCFR